MSGFSDIYKTIPAQHGYAQKDGIGWYQLPLLEKTGLVTHGFSARTGGISHPPYDTLNLSFSRTGEEYDTVRRNYRLFAAAAGFPLESMVMDTFEHGVTVRKVDAADKGRGFSRDPLPFCDGLVTDDPSVTLVTGHADCLALYFLDPLRRCIGLAHAGWKGTLHCIAKSMVRALQGHFGSRPESLLVGIGPCICEACFEVDATLCDTFREAFPGIPFYKEGKPGKAYVDLAMITAAQFLDAGIPAQSIMRMGVCTFESPDTLFSHRRDKGLTGGMAAFLKLEDSSDAFSRSPTAARCI